MHENNLQNIITEWLGEKKLTHWNWTNLNKSKLVSYKPVKYRNKINYIKTNI
jgi:hypothetical protein